MVAMKDTFRQHVSMIVRSINACLDESNRTQSNAIDEFLRSGFLPTTTLREHSAFFTVWPMFDIPSPAQMLDSSGSQSAAGVSPDGFEAVPGDGQSTAGQSTAIQMAYTSGGQIATINEVPLYIHIIESLDKQGT